MRLESVVECCTLQNNHRDTFFYIYLVDTILYMKRSMKATSSKMLQYY